MEFLYSQGLLPMTGEGSNLIYWIIGVLVVLAGIFLIISSRINKK